MIERFNSTLVDMISKYVDENQKIWDQYLTLLTAAYQSCKHEGTGYFPNMVMLGREVRQPVDLVIGVPDVNPAPLDHVDYVADLHARMKSIFEMVRATLKKSAERQKRDYDTRIAIDNYSHGDLVYMLDTTKTIGLSPKLKSDVWKGPCVITRKISDLLFEIKPGQKKRLN